MKQIATWIGIVIVIIVAVYGLIRLSNGASSTAPIQTVSSNMPPISNADNKTGNQSSKVILVEYGDFECPACGAEYPVLAQILQNYGNKIEFVFRNMPLTQLHPNALAGAETAYAAGRQGKFWDMWNVLYQHQNDWADLKDPSQTFLSYAKSLKLNIDQYKKDAADPNTKKFVMDQETGGINAGVNATPTLFLNGKMIQSDVPPSYDQLKQLLDSEIAKAK